MKKYSKIVLAMILSMIMFCLVACSSNGAGYQIKTQTLDEYLAWKLDSYISNIKDVKINKNSFILNGKIIVSYHPHTLDPAKLSYEFSPSKYFTSEYRTKYGSSGRDFFGQDVMASDPCYIVRVVDFPDTTQTLTCRIKLEYEGHSASQTLNIIMLGGSDALAAIHGWKKESDNQYQYIISRSDTKSQSGYHYNTVSNIDLSSYTLTSETAYRVLRYGDLMYYRYNYSFEYNAQTGILNIVDKTKQANVKTSSINLHMLYDKQKYDEDKANGWDWQMLNEFVYELRVLDSLLIIYGEEQYVSAFSNGKPIYDNTASLIYSYKYLFQITD